MKRIDSLAIVATTLCVVVASTWFMGCGSGKQDSGPASFAAEWLLTEIGLFNIYVPPNSKRSRRALLTYGESCNNLLDQVARYLELEPSQPLTIYLFNDNKECEAITGRLAGYVDGTSIYTRIGGKMGGPIAVAACHTIDPEADPPALITDGIREIFERADVNVHRKAAELRADERLLTLVDLILPQASDHREAYETASASFVAFLLQQHGTDRFKMIWRSDLEMQPSLERIYGGSIQQLQDGWNTHITREAQKT